MAKDEEKQKYSLSAIIVFSSAVVMFAANAGLTQSGHFNFWNWVLLTGAIAEVILGGILVSKNRNKK